MRELEVLQRLLTRAQNIIKRYVDETVLILDAKIIHDASYEKDPSVSSKGKI